MIALALTLALGAAAPAAATEKPKLLVLALTPGGGVDPQVAAALTAQVTEEIARRGFFTVLSAAEVQTLLGVERQRQLVGCSEETTSCLAELSGALGARFVVSGSLTRVGSAYQLSVQTLDSQRAQPVGRSTRLATDIAEFRSALPFLTAEATATPLPPPPSRLLPFSLIGAGGLALVGGMVLGMSALQREAAINSQLELGAKRPGVLDSVETYQREARATARMRTGALGAMLGGGALIGLGIYLNPPDVSRPGLAALWVGPGGVGFAGVLP